MRITDKMRLDHLSKTPGYGSVAVRVWRYNAVGNYAWLPPKNGVRRAIDSAIRASKRKTGGA